MFIAWGARSDVVHVDHLEPSHCARCGTDQPRNLYLTYRVRHLWYLFRWVSSRLYTSECSGCGQAQEVPRAEAQQGRPDPVGFMNRFGWAIGLGAILVIGVIAVVADQRNKAGDLELLAAPRVGDLYEVDMARIETPPEAPVMYSMMRVQSVTRDGVIVQASTLYYNQLRGVQRDLDSGRARQNDYYGADAGPMSRARLMQLQANGTLIDVIR
jgi:hypothetical protein